MGADAALAVDARWRPLGDPCRRRRGRRLRRRGRPSGREVYPLCPSRLLFGIDCPACRGLRGTHDLLRGHVGQALDHNLLLPGFLAILGGAGSVAPAARGPPRRALRFPRWATVGAVALLAAFTVARNLPLAPLEFLASG